MKVFSFLAVACLALLLNYGKANAQCPSVFWTHNGCITIFIGSCEYRVCYCTMVSGGTYFVHVYQYGVVKPPPPNPALCNMTTAAIQTLEEEISKVGAGECVPPNNWVRQVVVTFPRCTYISYQDGVEWRLACGRECRTQWDVTCLNGVKTTSLVLRSSDDLQCDPNITGCSDLLSPCHPLP